MGTLVAVFAHPDDETFICGGTLAKASSLDHHVHLLCATKGEMGRRMGIPPYANRESIASIREKELREACDHLGIAGLHFLSYRDKSLEIQPMDSMVAKITASFASLQPDWVITFHERLGGHPDHCTIGQATTIAFAHYQQTHPNCRLYFVSWPAYAKQPAKYQLDKNALVSIDIRTVKKQKWLAFGAHKTQSDLYDWVSLPEHQALSHLENTEWLIADNGQRGQVAEPFL